METSQWIISPFDIEVKSANLDRFHRGEFIEMNFDFETKSMYNFKGIGYYKINKKKTVTK